MINNGDQVYLDASFFIGYLVSEHPQSDKCRKLLAECFVKNCSFYVSPLIFDDTWGGMLRLLKRLHRQRIVSNQNLLGRTIDRVCTRLGYTRKGTADEPSYSGLHVMLKKHSSSMLALPRLNFIMVTPAQVNDLVDHALEGIEKYALAPKDAMHYSSMKLASITKILTGDNDFSRVSGITPISTNN